MIVFSRHKRKHNFNNKTDNISSSAPLNHPFYWWLNRHGMFWKPRVTNDVLYRVDPSHDVVLFEFSFNSLSAMGYYWCWYLWLLSVRHSTYILHITRSSIWFHYWTAYILKIIIGFTQAVDNWVVVYFAANLPDWTFDY